MGTQKRRLMSAKTKPISKRSDGFAQDRLSPMPSAEPPTLNLKDIEETLWKTADKLRNNLDAAEYKHVVLGLIFLKYISDSFEEHRAKLTARFADPADDYYLIMGGASAADIADELEDRDYYTADNVFWVPTEARWAHLAAHAKSADIGQRIDAAMVAIERENPRLKNLLNKEYGRERMRAVRLGELIDLIATIGFNQTEHRASDVLGHVYEYFLGQFAQAEGKKGGQFYTPKSIVNLIVEVLEPYEGRVYDPAMGSGGFFIASERFIASHADRQHADKRKQPISLYGQESNPTTWRLAAMNLAIRGIGFDFGREPADTFHADQHADLKADFIMANPPFNISDWGGEKLEKDKRWQFGLPPVTNANYAWLQHIVWHLAPHGSAGVVLANGSMSSTANNEGAIRQKLVEHDLVECMVALPGQLFTNTQIPASIWFLHRNKGRTEKHRDRAGHTLFIDARALGRMTSRVQRELADDDIRRIAATVHAWRTGRDYADQPGYCRSATLDDIRRNDFVLTPGRYVGAAAVADDGVPFSERMGTLTTELRGQFAESARLERAIRDNLRSLGYEV
jgi:type I restriction enzyme M protein